MGAPRLRQAFAAIVLAAASPAVAGFEPGEHMTAAEMYQACDAMLSGDLAGSQAHMCAAMLSAENMIRLSGTDPRCIEGKTVEQRAYAFNRQFASMPSAQRIELGQQPWPAIARDAFRRWAC